MATTNASETGRFERAISLGKDLFALLRDGSLFLLAVLLLLFPHSLNDILTNAGFEEGSIVGFKWKARLVETDDALKTATETIETLRAQLKQANDAIASATDVVPAGELKERIQQVEKDGRDVATASAATNVALQSTISANAPLIDRAPASLLAAGGWAVVFGSDKTLAAAQDEIARAAKAGIQGGAVYFRNGYYASLAVVATKEQATDYVNIVRSFRKDAYLTRFTSWCISPVQRDGYTECSPTR